MDTPRKNNDCYFYYYSTCLKGDGCTFRHEPAALGSETVCSFWAQGKCVNQPCNFRHMELKKNRKTIPCYWESQPSGCQKSHCSFQHKNPRPRDGAPRESDQSNNCDATGAVKPESPSYRPRRSVPGDGGESSEGEGSRRLNQEYNTTPVDPLVVNFEEESDNESVPASSPYKRVLASRAKTLEELHLERIQAESAAYYSYNLDKLSSVQDSPQSDGDDFHIMTLAEIRAKAGMQKNGGGSSYGKKNQDQAYSLSKIEENPIGQPKTQRIAVVRNYKKRAHSPIRFDISKAESSVDSKHSAVVETKCDETTESSAVTVETKLVVQEFDKEFGNEHKSLETVGLRAAKVLGERITTTRPVRLKRPRPELQSLNGSNVLTLGSIVNSNEVLGNVSHSQKVPRYDSSIVTQEIKVFDSRNSSDLVVGSQTDSKDLGVVVGEKSIHPSVTVDTEIKARRSSAVCKSRIKDRDESMDEDMLLESSTVHPDDDVLPDDIDAFLND